MKTDNKQPLNQTRQHRQTEPVVDRPTNNKIESIQIRNEQTFGSTNKQIDQARKLKVKIEGKLPFYRELLESERVTNWLRRNMEGSGGNKQLEKLQEQIKQEYGVEIKLTERTERKINQVKEQGSSIGSQEYRQERPKERRETFQERKSQRIENNRTRITEEMKKEKTKKDQIWPIDTRINKGRLIIKAKQRPANTNAGTL